MARILAIDWDRHEVRYLLATERSGKVKVQAAGSAPLPPAGSPEEHLQPDVGQALCTALAPQRTAGATVLVGVSRAGVEMLHFRVPPAKEAELPELVLNQALRESQAVTEEWAIDFLVAPGNPAEPRAVTAAALAPEEQERIRAACAAAGLKPRRIVLRAYASASLFAQTGAVPERICLLVNLLGDEADLTVLVERRPVYLRTVRLPGSVPDEKAVERLVAEMRRTLAAGLEDEPGEETVQAIYVLGGAGEHGALAQRFHDEFQLPSAVFDPFQAVGAPEDRVPEGAGRFASLVGMALDEARGAAHPIDLLRPRRRAKPQSRLRTLAYAGLGLAALLLAGGYYAWDAVAAVNAENRELTRHLKELDRLVKRAGEQRRTMEAVHEWQAGDITWLDELRDLSIRFPSGRDMVVLGMAMTSSGRAGGGEIEMKGVVRDQSIVSRMENNIRDKYHEVRSKRVQGRVPERAYSWQFQGSMSVGRRDKSRFTSHLPQQPAEVGGPATPAVGESPPPPASIPVPATLHHP